MVKRILFRLLDTLLVSVLLFFLSYAFFEIKLKSNNSAMLFSVFTSLSSGCAYFLVRGIFLSKKDKKEEDKTRCEQILKNLHLMPEKQYLQLIGKLLKDQYHEIAFYKNLLTAKNAEGMETFIFCCRSAPGLPLKQQELMKFIRTFILAKGDLFVLVALTGIEKGGTELINNYGIKPQIIAFNQINELLTGSENKVPQYVCVKQKQKNQKLKLRFTAFLKNPKSFGVCIKYSLFLLMFSVFTPYKFYYITAAVILTGIGIISRINIKRFQDKNIF